MAEELELFGPSEEEAELLILAIDSSGTMAINDVHGGKRRADVLKALAEGLVDRLSKTEKARRYRISTVYFSESVEAEPYKLLHEVKIRHPLDEVFPEIRDPQKRLTCIACALEKANEILDDFNKGEGLPDRKYATIFLFTDGRENVKEKIDVKNAARKVRRHDIKPTIATIALGTKEEVDPELLWEISSECNERQKRHMVHAKVLRYVEESNSRVRQNEELKLFLWARDVHEAEITERFVEAMRQFVYVLSETRVRG